MEEVIKIPALLVNRIEEIKSLDIQKFLKSIDNLSSIEEKIDIKYLRDYYKKHENNFNDLIDELIIRGFRFFTNKPNNLLYDIEITNFQYIMSNEKSDYKNIKFEKFDLGNFLNRFSVKSNDFFDLIPIEGFKALNINIDLVQLEKEFIKNKFDIRELNEKMVDKEVGFIQNGKYDGESLKSNKNIRIYKQEQFIEDAKIINIFNENEFIGIKEYFLNINIKNISEIQNYMIAKYCDRTQINDKKVEKILDKFIKLAKVYKHQYDIYSIDVWYANSKFCGFREFCKSRNKIFVNEITNILLLEFNNKKKPKNILFINIAEKLKKYEEKIAIDELKEEDKVKNKNYEEDKLLVNIFTGIKHSSLICYFMKNNITFIEDITNEIIIDYCNARGIGLAKIKSFKDILIKFYIKDNEENNFKYNIHHVKFWFSEIKFNLFREFCQENDIKNVDDITEEVFINYPKCTKVSQATLISIRKKIEEYKENSFEKNINEEREVEIINIKTTDNCYDKIKKLYISDVLNILGIESNIKSNYRLSDINGKNIHDLGLSEYKKDIYKLVKMIDKIKPLKYILKGFDQILEEDEKKILDYRYNQGYTLEQVGEKFEVTRERIRQKQKKAETKIINYFIRTKFIKVINLEFSGAKCCKMKDLYGLVELEKEFYFKILIKNSSQILYLADLNLLYLRDFKNITLELKLLFNELPEIFKMSDYLDSIIEKLSAIGVEKLEIDKIEELLINNGYRFYNKYCSKSKLTATQIIDIIFKEYIKTPLRIDENGFYYLNKISKDYFGQNLGTNNRSVEGKVRNNQEIILVDKLTFININNFTFNREIIGELKEILEKIFIKRNIVNVAYVFEQNQEYLIKNGIKNKHSLYSIIFYYFGKIYKSSVGNTLDIYKSHEINNLSKLEILEEIISFHNGKINKKEVCKLTGWAEFQVENCIADSKKLIKLNNEIIYFSALNMTEQESLELKKLLEILMIDKKYTSSVIIFKEMMFNNILAKFIKRNNIKNNESIATLVKKFDNSLCGHTNLILKNTCEYKTIDDVIRGTFKGEFTKDELRKFISDLGYKDMMCRLTINKAIEDNIFIEISKDDLIHVHDYLVDGQAVEGLIQYIEEEIEGKDYLILTDLIGYRKKLPSINYRWNPYLMKSILVKNGYKIIKRSFDDIRSEKLILVKENSEYNTYADLILDLIKNHYDGNMHEVKIYEFLENCGVVNKQQYLFDKKIPYDLKYIGKVKVDEFGRVQIL